MKKLEINPKYGGPGWATPMVRVVLARDGQSQEKCVYSHQCKGGVYEAIMIALMQILGLCDTKLQLVETVEKTVFNGEMDKSRVTKVEVCHKGIVYSAVSEEPIEHMAVGEALLQALLQACV